MLIVEGRQGDRRLTGQAVSPLPTRVTTWSSTTACGWGSQTAIASFKLTASDRAVRLAAAKELQNSADEDALPAISAALAREIGSGRACCSRRRRSSSRAATARRGSPAIRALAHNDRRHARLLQNGSREEDVPSSSGRRPRSGSRPSARSPRSEGRLAATSPARIFSGISLGTILLLPPWASRSPTASWASSTWRTASSS